MPFWDPCSKRPSRSPSPCLKDRFLLERQPSSLSCFSWVPLLNSIWGQNSRLEKCWGEAEKNQVCVFLASTHSALPLIYITIYKILSEPSRINSRPALLHLLSATMSRHDEPLWVYLICLQMLVPIHIAWCFIFLWKIFPSSNSSHNGRWHMAENVFRPIPISVPVSLCIYLSI